MIINKVFSISLHSTVLDADFKHFLVHENAVIMNKVFLSISLHSTVRAEKKETDDVVFEMVSN